MPLKTFYRYALPAIPAYPPPAGAGAASELPAPAAAVFSGLPPNKVLTLGMDEPEPWCVRAGWSGCWWLAGGVGGL